MSQPTLSVIVPAWNEEKYIGRAIDSLRHAAQVYERERGCAAEISVVDNNSQDRTGDVAREHGAQVVLEPEQHRQSAQHGRQNRARQIYRVLRRRQPGHRELIRTNKFSVTWLSASQNAIYLPRAVLTPVLRALPMLFRLQNHLRAMLARHVPRAILAVVIDDADFRRAT